MKISTTTTPSLNGRTFYLSTPAHVSALKAGLDDMCARADLLKERGGKIVGEVWVAEQGLQPVYAFDLSLSEAECEVLELCPWRGERFVISGD